MLIGLIADTHIPRNAKILPPHVRTAFQGVELIIHAGDIYTPAVLDALEKIAPVLAVSGNGDWDFPPDPRFQRSQVINTGGLSIGAIHGINYPPVPQYPIEGVMEREFGQIVDVLVFGDTHVAIVDRYNGTLLINPGSPTLPNGLFELGTVGLLEIAGSEVSARIVDLNDLPLSFYPELVYYRGAGA